VSGIGRDESRRGLARSSGLIAGLAGLGVLTGFVVDAAMAARFGAGAQTDAYFVAATIPFALASVLLASANQILVPLIASWYDDEDTSTAADRVRRLLGSALVAAVGLAIVGIALSPFIPWVLAPGLSSSSKDLASDLLVLLFLTVITRVGAEVFRAALNARFHFGVPAAMPIVENVVVLATMLTFASRLGVEAVALGYLFGGVAQLVFVGASALRHRLPIRPRWGFRDPHVRSAFRLLALPLGGTGLNMLARAVERFLASFLPAGSITILNYAWVVVNGLGGAVFFRSVIVALLPRLTGVRRDDLRTRATVADGIKLMSLISIPLAFLTAALAAPLVHLAFQRGAFTAASAGILAGTLAVYACQLPLDAVNRVFMAFWYSRLVTITPFRNTALAAGLDVVLAAVLVWPLGIEGIALAYVLASVGQVLHGHATVRRALELRMRPLWPFIGRVIVASALAAFAALAMRALLPEGNSFVARVLALGLPGLVGLTVLMGALLALGIKVWRALGRPAGPPAPA
jgi:putative peptidoglycan lipid II flippase